MIDRLKISRVDIEPPVRRTDATQVVSMQNTILLEVFTSEGDSGIGYTYATGTGADAIVALLEKEFAPLLIGKDPTLVERIWSDLFRHVFYVGAGSVTAGALAAVDVALWALRCQRAGLPLYRMAGGAQSRIPMYNTDLGWLHLSQPELVDNARRINEAGFRGFKVKVGRPTLREDLERLTAVREALDPGVELMVDANKLFTSAEAIRRAKAFEPLGLAWFEEPLPPEDVDGHTRLCASTSIPIAAGECLFHPAQFREYLQRQACSIVMPDVGRIGGITPWLKVAHLAETFNVAVTPHYLMEIHVAMAAAVPNCFFLEYLPHLDPVTSAGMRMENGYAYPSEEPGTGIRWDREAIARLCSPAGALELAGAGVR